MQEYWFYIQLGFNHVLDKTAYDHVLFLAALALPFSFKTWKKILLLATVFTIAHCLSLALSVYKIKVIDAEIIELLIPITIILTASYNLYSTILKKEQQQYITHLILTAFFGLIHGFGFSNYFKMLMAEEEDKFTPLLGFATGIEISQAIILICILTITYIAKNILHIKQKLIIIALSLLIICISIPLFINAL